MGFIATNSKLNMENIIKNGATGNINEIWPSYINFENPKQIDIDSMLVGCLIITNYSREMEGVFLEKIIESDIKVQLSMFYEKQNSYDVIKELTYNISNAGANIKTSGENQSDIDKISGVYGDAKYIRKQLQIGDEDLYYLNIYVAVYADSEFELESNLQKLEGTMVGIGLQTRRATYRQKQTFLSTLPILDNENEIKKITYRNVLTRGLVSTYPFVSNELNDEHGVVLGINSFNNSIVLIDRFDSSKYKNANMCIIGTSGSGKSYFVKMMIGRNRIMNVTQYIIDPDREYGKLCSRLNGTLIKFSGTETINVMDIRENCIDENESYLQNKLSKLNAFFSIIFKDINASELADLEEVIIKIYNEKNITFDNESLYEINNNTSLIKKKTFKKESDMPVLEDVYAKIKTHKTLKKYASTLKPYISGSAKYFNGHTNVDVSNKLVVADIHDIEEEKIPLIMFVITELYWDKIKSQKNQKKIIYLDEVWKLISQNDEAAEFVFKIFKTIRKFGGAATAITQDIGDFFSLNDGKYGQSIINNSSIKCLFQMEENDINKLQSIMNLSEEEKYRLINMERGKCILHAGRNKLMVDIKASPKEHEVINTDILENN